ncbi:hypothetical protein Cgig2_032329 [Carnegiea gigantea]|uniref:Uncharacterized protein n=1 Tax=Carnegiea gigantea TaxID=171969 RepID=A0A9Q1KJ13_9CARY|nr:hypothetical protein Cgig2_032329 [Carnegiea gigantea]
MSTRGGRGNRRGRGRGTGGDGQPPPRDFSEDQSNVPVHDPQYSFAYVNPNQPQGRGTPSQPLGIQATGCCLLVQQAHIQNCETAQNKGEEPTDIVLFSNTHQSGDPMTKGKWVDGKSQQKAEEHRKRWEEYRNSHLSSDDSSQGLAVSERDMWLEANKDSKGHIYGFGSEVSTRSSSVKNYDAREMATRLNESVSNQLERENREPLLKKVDYLADVRKKDKSKIKMMWNFIKRHASGPSNEPPQNILSSDDEDGGDGAPPDGDD